MYPELRADHNPPGTLEPIAPAHRVQSSGPTPPTVFIGPGLRGEKDITVRNLEVGAQSVQVFFVVDGVNQAGNSSRRDTAVHER